MLVRADAHLVRRHAAISRRVPLAGNIRTSGRERIRDRYLLTRAKGATNPSGPVTGGGPPFMIRALFAPPPAWTTRSRRQIRRAQQAVERGMPLGSDLRETSRKTRLFRERLLT